MWCLGVSGRLAWSEVFLYHLPNKESRHIPDSGDAITLNMQNIQFCIFRLKMGKKTCVEDFKLSISDEFLPV